MRIFRALFLIFAVAICSTSAATTQTPARTAAGDESVDEFDHGGHTVMVYFTDPLLEIMGHDPTFASRAPREQAQALSDYLHHNVVYRFVITEPSGELLGELALEGDPDITDSAAFYRVVERRLGSTGIEEVGRHRIGVRGMLFEHMALFQTNEGRRAIGSGIALFEGIFMRVTPYSEVKEAMLLHIDRIIE